MLKLTGYSDAISVAPAGTIRFMVSAQDLPSYEARIVRIIHGDANPQGPGFKAEAVEASVNRSYPGRFQAIHAGSCITVPHHAVFERLESFTLAVMIWPTTPGKGRQSLMAKRDPEGGAGLALEIDEKGALALVLDDGGGKPAAVSSGKALRPRQWYLAAASFDAISGRATIHQIPRERYPLTDDQAEVTQTVALRPGTNAAPLTMAARWTGDDEGRFVGDHYYNGKLDSPRIAAESLPLEAIRRLLEMPLADDLAPDIVAAWDFAQEIPSTRAVDLGPHRLHGTCLNLPARAMKGWRWTGAEQNWTRKPEHYGAIHFHDDDIYDAGWQADFAWTVPEGTRSGVYAAHIASPDGEAEDYIPFAVRPPRGQATADVVLLLPTASYMAYANDHNAVDAADAEMVTGRLIVLQPGDVFADEHREYGLALYDTHSDGSGVCYSSRLRPILNMRPKYSSWLGGAGSGLWQFNADTHLVDWLEAKGIRVDVITDEDLHREGYDLLAPYRVILSGTHPEYHSTAMWDAMKAYLDRGGRLMYLGANGWYWRIAWHSTLPGVIEVRRAEDGIRTWEAEPGEYYQSFNGEFGGLWRRVGRPPNLMVGTGFTAQGFDVSSYYRRKPDSYDPRAGFVFEGIGDDDIIGDFGLVGGGAAGLELDRASRSLGTPPHTLCLASSEAHSDLYLVVNEEFTVTTPNLSGSQHPKVRADMVFFETGRGGAVFSVSSIAWCGSLSHNDYDNNVSRITENVLRRFLDPAPFPL